MKRVKKDDVILQVGRIMDEVRLDPGVEVREVGLKKGRKGEELIMSGKMDVGRSGRPVTILVEDEETGEALEINHVRNAMLLIEDNRKSTSSWLSLLIGDIEKVGGVIKFVAKASLEELQKLLSKSREGF